MNVWTVVDYCCGRVNTRMGMYTHVWTVGNCCGRVNTSMGSIPMCGLRWTVVDCRGQSFLDVHLDAGEPVDVGGHEIGHDRGRLFVDVSADVRGRQNGRRNGRRNGPPLWASVQRNGPPRS